MEAWSPKTTIEAGDVVAVIALNLGLWWLNACRIVYVVDEEEPIRRQHHHDPRELKQNQLPSGEGVVRSVY